MATDTPEPFTDLQAGYDQQECAELDDGDVGRCAMAVGHRVSEDVMGSGEWSRW